MFVCLTGIPVSQNDLSYVVQDVDYCQLFSTFNETIGQTVKINFAMTKVINRTESLSYDGITIYSGIWIPTATHGILDHHLSYSEREAFLRYLSTQHRIIISFSETEFYVINQQAPIARKNEVLFHNILFATTAIGLFALGFLLFKLILMPIIKAIMKHEKFLLKYLKSEKEILAETSSTF